MAIEWTERLSIGNEILDADHKEMFGLAGDVECAIQAMDQAALVRSFKQLRDCMSRHFLNEELFAHALNIPFAEHHIDYQNILAGIDLVRREISENVEGKICAIENYSQLLQIWMLKNNIEYDMLMKPILQTRQYGFKIKGVFAGETVKQCRRQYL